MARRNNPGTLAAVLALAATLDGTVKDRQSDRPLGGAEVTVVGTGRKVTTDREGHFSLEGIPSGKHAFKVEAPGYFPFVAQDLPFDDARPIQVTVALRPGMAVAHRQTVSGTKPSRKLRRAAGPLPPRRCGRWRGPETIPSWP